MKYIVILLIVIIIIVVLIFNSFIKSLNRVKEAFATMDVYLKKRWELIPNLVATIKGYAFYEKQTFERVIANRNQYDSLNYQEKQKNDSEMESTISAIVALKEAYPELKANENFQKLFKELITIEDELVNARKYYNATVRLFNTKIMTFPNIIFAKIFRFKPYPMFNINNEEKDNVEVSL